MEELIKSFQQLTKALEAGNYNQAPSGLVQGAALQVEDLSPVLHNVCFQEKHLILAKMLGTASCKSNLYQFDRQLSYGGLGYGAQVEGNVGQEENSDFVRVVVPMAFYSHLRKTTHVANAVETVDGKQASERVAEDAAKKTAADIELDCFRGLEDFSNGGIFDGHPGVVPMLPGMHGILLQIRQSDAQRNAQDLMFAAYGSSDSVVVNAGGPLTQGLIEDLRNVSDKNWGNAETLLVDTDVLSTYNKISFGKERIVLAGSPQDATGSSLKRQFVASGTVDIKSSHFLRGRKNSDPIRKQSPAAPTISAVNSVTVSGVTTPFVAGEKYNYVVTDANEAGESGKTAATQGTIAVTGDSMQVVMTAGAGTVRYFNVYRSANNGSAASAKFVGRVIAASSGNTTFIDLGNKLPGFVTGILIDAEGMEIRELKPFTKEEMAQVDLSKTHAFYRFCTTVVEKPRRSVIAENLTK